MMPEDVPSAVNKFAATLPRFSDGRIDYHGSDEAPVVSIFVKFGDKILLLKRSDKVLTYKGKWNTVAGYLDELRPLREKVLEELREEIGLKEDRIVSIKLRNPYTFRDRGMTWIVHPALVEIKSPEIRLDWEHTQYLWVRPEEMKNYDVVPELEKGLKIALFDD